MLLIEVSQIPPEGLDVHETLAAGEVRVEGEKDFSLHAGGRLDCHLERGEDQTVHVRGRMAAGLGLECGRCLEPFTQPLDQELDLFYLPHRPDQEREEEDEVELSDHEIVVAYYRDNRVDLGEMVREQVFLALPMKRLCREDCRGLCPTCGANRNALACGCAPEVNPQLSPLGAFFGRGSS
jgi:uncharacterized protein